MYDMVSLLFDKRQKRRQELIREFPGRIMALCSSLGISPVDLRVAMGAGRGQFYRYLRGERVPAGPQMLLLVQLARTVPDGLDLLTGSTDEAIDMAGEAQQVLERKLARRRGRKVRDSLGTKGAHMMSVEEFFRLIPRMSRLKSQPGVRGEATTQEPG